MTSQPPAKQKSGPSPQQLERLAKSLRAAEIAQEVAKLQPARPAETYGKIRDERGNAGRICSSPQ